MKFVLATRNSHKAIELKRILEELELDCELLTVSDFPGAPEVEETEDTFEGNALLKARALANFTGLAAIADDSGICVDALDGNPGVLSARWSGATENIDRANLELVLEQIKGVPPEHRGAKFVCAAVAVFPQGKELVAVGEMFGNLLDAPTGENGFGYDPIFVPTGFTKTTAEMSASEKDSISHRGLALKDLALKIKG
ncbi:MAG: RdgB/HAM1 family non-canonical purine NTP pyrophosphatase [Actinobacteria bacterium]|nr:RdgB/HAM1 family non-canonical purine NTP pyrophosphatase [Actinomycetota bacterium]NBO34685.1 RdgB/HAM1 family non-canonical purine NTP pyrophosphatase [Actinomycetota bacterium]